MDIIWDKQVKDSIDFEKLKEDYQRDGFAMCRGLFGQEEVKEIKDYFMELHPKGEIPVDHKPESDKFKETGSLANFPRVMQPHRFSERCKHYLIHPGVMACLEALLGEEALAAQSMFYYKPPGARGQALHQDNLYLMVEPQTCIAAWTAIDDADRENGGMYAVPHTEDMEIVCPEQADTSESWTNHLVSPPPGKKAVEAKMKAGDTLFFNGSVIHGSGPNRSKTRFRRSFICHYMPASSKKISKYYQPLINSRGEEIRVENSSGGGPCGSDWEGAVH